MQNAEKDLDGSFNLYYKKNTNTTSQNVNNFVKELLNNNDKFHEIMLNCLDKSKEPWCQNHN